MIQQVLSSEFPAISQFLMQTRPILSRMNTVSYACLFTLSHVDYLLLLPLQDHQSQQKAWKVRAPTAPASLSCVPRAAFIWRMSTSTPDSDPAFSLPSIRTDLCFTKITQPLYSFYSSPPAPPPSPVFCFCDQSRWQPWTEVHRDEGGRYDSCKDALGTLLYDWCLKNIYIVSPALKTFH